MFYYRIRDTERFQNLLFGNVVITKEWTASETIINDPRLESKEDNPVFIPAPPPVYAPPPVPETPKVVLSKRRK